MDRGGVRNGPFEGDSVFMFFISLFHFFLKKDVFLLFFFFSFTYVSLLATVSESNYRCFIRSRCSREMWCPDDKGPDGWDWVGPHTWERHNSTPQSGVETPRLFKRSLPRLYLWLLLLLVAV